jgi:chromosome segregation ATPase
MPQDNKIKVDLELGDGAKRLISLFEGITSAITQSVSVRNSDDGIRILKQQLEQMAMERDRYAEQFQGERRAHQETRRLYQEIKRHYEGWMPGESMRAALDEAKSLLSDAQDQQGRDVETIRNLTQQLEEARAQIHSLTHAKAALMSRLDQAGITRD